MLQVRLDDIPGAVRYIGEYIYQAVLRQGILGVYKGGEALLRSRTRRPRCPCWALGSCCPRRTLGPFRALCSRRTLWTFRALLSRRALGTFRALCSRRTLRAFRALCSRRALGTFPTLGTGCSCRSCGTILP